MTPRASTRSSPTPLRLSATTCGRLDATAAWQAVEDLRGWPGERYGHRGLLERAWELRGNVRVWDAVYVALAEALGATLLTLDRRVAQVPGLACPIEVVGSG